MEVADQRRLGDLAAGDAAADVELRPRGCTCSRADACRGRLATGQLAAVIELEALHRRHSTPRRWAPGWELDVEQLVPVATSSTPSSTWAYGR
jgi:hypothetical protein